MNETNNIKSVAIIMKRSDELAFHYRKNTKTFCQCWAFAGGGINDDETPIDAAQRNLKEETGLIISKNRFKLLTNCYIENQACSIFEVNLNNLEEPKHIKTETHTGWSWMTIPDSMCLKTIPGIQDVIRSNYFVEF